MVGGEEWQEKVYGREEWKRLPENGKESPLSVHVNGLIVSPMLHILRKTVIRTTNCLVDKMEESSRQLNYIIARGYIISVSSVSAEKKKKKSLILYVKMSNVVTCYETTIRLNLHLFFKPMSFISSPFCYIYGHNKFYFIATFGSLSIRSVTNSCLTKSIYVNNIFLLD